MGDTEVEEELTAPRHWLKVSSFFLYALVQKDLSSYARSPRISQDYLPATVRPI